MRVSAVLWILLIPGCIVFHDRAGVPVSRSLLDGIVVGETSRAEVMQRLGAPTGIYDADLLGSLLALGGSERQPGTPELMHPDVATWQQVDVTGRALLFPVLFFHGTSTISARTAIVFFDPQGIVSAVGYREDDP